VAAGDSVAIGRELYRNHCQPCHTRRGYNGLGRYLAHWDGATVRDLLPRLQHLRGRMPAWHGTAAESEALARHLERVEPRGAPWPAEPAAGRRLAWDLSCGLCHTVAGWRALQPSLAGLSAEDLEVLVDSVQEMTDAMPPYRAGAPQRASLLEQLAAIAAGKEAAPAGTAGGRSADADADVAASSVAAAEGSAP
jgi:mono/diheme cytochrome c family protein